MSHDPTKFVMGGHKKSDPQIINKKGEIEAGLVCRLKSDDSLSVATADGSTIGVSMGRSLSDIPRTSVATRGLGIPVKLASGFNPTVGTAVAISDTTGEAKAYTGTGDRYVNAVYTTGRLGGSGATGGVAEATGLATVGVALIDFPGGL